MFRECCERAAAERHAAQQQRRPPNSPLACQCGHQYVISYIRSIATSRHLKIECKASKSTSPMVNVLALPLKMCSNNLMRPLMISHKPSQHLLLLGFEHGCLQPGRCFLHI